MKCEHCGRETNVTCYEYNAGYKWLCENCAKDLKAKPIATSNLPTRSQKKETEKKNSSVFMIITVAIAAIGLIAGAFFGFRINYTVMLSVWAATAILCISSYALYCHLSNQETMIELLKGRRSEGKD